MINWDQRVDIEELQRAQEEARRKKKLKRRKLRCKECGKGFWQKNVRQKYCCTRHRDRFHTRQNRRKHWRTCPECSTNPILTPGAERCKNCQAKRATQARQANVASNRKLQRSIEKMHASL